MWRNLQARSFFGCRRDFSYSEHLPKWNMGRFFQVRPEFPSIHFQRQKTRQTFVSVQRNFWEFRESILGAEWFISVSDQIFRGLPRFSESRKCFFFFSLRRDLSLGLCAELSAIKNFLSLATDPECDVIFLIQGWIVRNLNQVLW